jgi:hypothetical protein
LVFSGDRFAFCSASFRSSDGFPVFFVFGSVIYALLLIGSPANLLAVFFFFFLFSIPPDAGKGAGVPCGSL